MAVRLIDAEKVLKHFRFWIETNQVKADERKAIETCIKVIENTPTLTQPNEPLTLISMNDELPPDKERVLVYRPCMADSDIGPYSVQWGWAAKKDGSHWAHLPNRRPDEKDETL